jgi:hypothetical protein
MDKKELKQITTKIYEEYGFVKKGKYYYLDLEEVIICSGFSSIYGITYLAYNFSVKAVHSEEERQPNNMFDGYDSFEIEMYFDRKAEGYHKKEIRYEEWDKEFYMNKLNELLCYYFDPYKKDALNHIKKCHQVIGFLHENDIVPVKTKARKYLGLS